jgi:glycosyltransferase involved in cell wall biosynthesis
VLHNALTANVVSCIEDMPIRRVPDPYSDLRILNVGRLSLEKGQMKLLDAVATLSRDYPGVRLTFAGTGPLREALAERANELGITDRVRFLGYVHDMTQLYWESDLVVQSSITEGLPNVVLEGASLGVPIVATDVGGTTEVLDPGLSGLLVHPGSSLELERGMRAYLADPGEFIERARKRVSGVRALFSMAARTERQMHLYEELMAEAR